MKFFNFLSQILIIQLKILINTQLYKKILKFLYEKEKKIDSTNINFFEKKLYNFSLFLIMYFMKL